MGRLVVILELLASQILSDSSQCVDDPGLTWHRRGRNGIDARGQAKDSLEFFVSKLVVILELLASQILADAQQGCQPEALHYIGETDALPDIGKHLLCSGASSAECCIRSFLEFFVGRLVVILELLASQILSHA